MASAVHALTMKNAIAGLSESQATHLFRTRCRSAFGMSGFTLIELLIAVVVVAVLAAIALPSYSAYIARARRAEARTHLVEAAQFMQRLYASNDSFVTDRANNAVIDQMPNSAKRSPADAAEGTQLYNLEIPLGVAPLTNAMSFTLRMVPAAGGAMANDDCGTFTLTSVGVRGVLVAGAVGETTVRDGCWK